MGRRGEEQRPREDAARRKGVWENPRRVRGEMVIKERRQYGRLSQLNSLPLVLAWDSEEVFQTYNVLCVRVCVYTLHCRGNFFFSW